MRKLFVAFTTAAVLFSAPAFAQTEGTPGSGAQTQEKAHGHKYKGGKKGKNLEALNLTEDQRNRILEIHRDFDPRMSSLHDQMKPLRQSMRDARISGGTVDESLRSEMKEIKGQMKALKSEKHAQIVEILTPEQRAQFEQQKTKRR